MEKLNETIKQLFASSRVKEVLVFREMTEEQITKVSYTTLSVLEDNFGKLPQENKPWRAQNPLVNIACALGRLLLLGLEDYESIKERNITRFKVGYVVLNGLATAGLIKFHRAKVEGKKTRDKYQLQVVDHETMIELLALVDAPGNEVCVYTRPQFQPPLPFERFQNTEAGALVRNINPEARSYFSYENCPMVFDVINKHMEVSYNVNTEALEVYKQSLTDNIFTHEEEIVEGLLDPIQVEGLYRERDKVIEIAEMVGDRQFWEYMFYDSRGRIYSSAVYLSHAGCKLSKSLFLYNERKPIGEEGWFWLLVHTANCFGEDKLTIDGRFDYANDKLDSWMEIASDPVNNKLWQKADDPFNFLAAIMDIKKAMAHDGGVFDYPSGLPVAWDATCSGLQVLSALSKDEVSGALCNLTDSDVRGDYYKYIADHVWEDCTFNNAEERVYNTITEDLSVLEKNIKKALDSNNKEWTNEAFEARKAYVEKNKESIFASSKVYWGKLKDKRRSICKRPCMTYFYSCQEKTMAKAMLKDHGGDKEFKGLNFYYAKWMADRIYKACREKMDKPTALMDLFIDLGMIAYKEGKDFSVDAPLTNFKLMQYYRTQVGVDVNMTHKGKKIMFKVTIGNDKLDKGKIASATSPNVVHMLDSQIVAGVVMKADYTVSCIHDSFSTHAADGGKLFYDCRDTFVDIFKEDVLVKMFGETGVTYGSLDITNVYDNDYNFS